MFTICPNVSRARVGVDVVDMRRDLVSRALLGRPAGHPAVTMPVYVPDTVATSGSTVISATSRWLNAGNVRRPVGRAMRNALALTSHVV